MHETKIFSKKQPEVVRLPEADDEADEDRRRANEEAGASDSHVPLFAGSRRVCHQSPAISEPSPCAP